MFIRGLIFSLGSFFYPIDVQRGEEEEEEKTEVHIERTSTKD